MGETATHTVCYAQLIINGESKGVHSFLVPLRDPETHRVLPNIRLGDCGSKMGINGTFSQLLVVFLTCSYQEWTMAGFNFIMYEFHETICCSAMLK